MMFDKPVSTAVLRTIQLPFSIIRNMDQINYWIFKDGDVYIHRESGDYPSSVLEHTNPLYFKHTFYVNSKLLKKSFPVLAIV